MKLSFLTFACPDWRFDEIIEAAGRFGYHGIEFRCDAGHNHGVEATTSALRRRELATRLERADIEPVCLATSLTFLDDDVMDQVPARLELAGDIGFEGVRVFCGVQPPGMGRDQAINRAASQLRLAADFADEYGVQIWLETHDSAGKAMDAAEIVHLADHPAIGLCWDNLNTHRAGEDLEATKTALRDVIRHTHFHNGLNRRSDLVITPLD